MESLGENPISASPRKIWQQGEYENAQGWSRFGKIALILILLGLPMGFVAAVILNN